MEKRQVLSIVTLICYLIMVGCGAALAIANHIGLDNIKLNGSGLGQAIGAVAIAIIMVIAVAYAAIGVIPIILKIIHIFADSKVPAAICLFFDVLYILANCALLVSQLTSGDAINLNVIAIPAALTVVSLIAFITNIASMKD